MTIAVDWKKLKDYKFDKRKSFEELCFQVAYENYAHVGTFVSIDDSGGGSGVEFYLIRPNGAVWGWQAKFYPQSRFTTGRRAQVKDSLRQSLKDHKRLEKWFLCAPTDFTTKGNHPEHKWFYKELQRIGPKVEKIFWGERFLVNQLARPELAGRRHFFFGDLEFSSKWCRGQVEGQLAAVGSKYIPSLHTAMIADDAVADAVGDSRALQRTVAVTGELRKAGSEFVKALNNLETIKVRWPQSYEQSRQCITTLLTIFQSALTIGEFFSSLLAKGDIHRAQSVPLPSQDRIYEVLESLTLDDLRAAEGQAREQDDRAAYERLMDDHGVAQRPANILETFWNTIAELSTIIQRCKSSTLHLLGSAGHGKTHLSCAIADKRTRLGLPAILLRGIRFTGERSLKEQILSLLDVPKTYSWEDLLSALDTMGIAYRTRVPVIVDGLNEAQDLRRWQVELPEIAADIGRYQNIILVTTCRTNYSERIWPSPTGTFITLQPASGETLEELTAKYFDYYRLSVTTAFASLSSLNNPLYLRLFCEANNPDRVKTVSVHLADQTTLVTFRQYLNGVYKHVGEQLDKPDGVKIVQECLLRFAKALWQTDARELPLSTAIELLDGISDKSPTFKWTNSITRMLLDEDLVITRERGYQEEGQEIIRFTYDFMAGLLVADALIGDLALTQARCFLGSGVPRLTDRQSRHPLWDDITRCLCLVVPERFGHHLYEFTPNEALFSASIHALFELAPSLLRPRDAALIRSLVQYESNRRSLLYRLVETSTVPGHVLNATFLDGVLHRMSMADRDLSWTEDIRGHIEHFQRFLLAVRKALKSLDRADQSTVDRIRLAAIVSKWLLASTDHRIRDYATRTLISIGLRFPGFLFRQTLNSLNENDPYVSERMLAAAYGTAMYLHERPDAQSFRDDDLPYFAQSLYWLMFRVDANFRTTHALTREYARGILECAQHHHPSLLHFAPRATDGRVKFPKERFKFRRFEFPPTPNEYVNDHILGHDWGNYTLGHLVPSRSSYDFGHEGYKAIRQKVLWRISDLGYDPVRFASVDKEIAHFHWNRTDQQGRVDRYGKKYAWIAYFELYGALYDLGQLRGRWLENHRRPLDFDIDPTFPRVRRIRVTSGSLFAGPEQKPKEWLRTRGEPEHVKSLLCTRRFDPSAEWVMLDGWQSAYSTARAQNSFCMIKMYIAPNEQRKRLYNLFSVDKPRGGWLEHPLEERGVFAGEIPWSAEVAPDELRKLEFIMGFRTIWRDVAPFDVLRKGYKTRIRQGKIKDRVPVLEYLWALNPVRNNALETRSPFPRESATIPSQSLLEYARLQIRPPYWDFYDASGRLGSLHVSFGGSPRSQHFTYFRRDLFDSFLKAKSAAAIWVVWGERQLLTPGGMNQAYRYYKRLHKYVPAP